MQELRGSTYTGQHSALKSRVERLKGENQALRDRVEAFKEEKRALQKDLRAHRKLLKEIPGGVVLIVEDKILFVNETTRRLLDCTEEELLGRSYLDFLHPDVVEYETSIHHKRLSGKPAPYQYETYINTKNDEAVCIEVRIKKIRYNGRTAFLVDGIDLDKRKQEEVRLRRSKKMEAIDRMASGLKREVGRCVDLLREHAVHLKALESFGDSALAESLRRIEAVTKRADSITRQLDSLTRKRLDISDTVLFDLRKVVQDAVETTRPKWKGNPESRGVKINVRTHLRTLSPIRGRPEEMEDVFVSMVLNAVDALPNGGDIYLTAEENSGLAHVYIQDNGVGIPDNVKERIFDPFFTTKGDSRLGLGLSLDHAITTRHGGEIEVISQEGRGATFVIKLPLAQKTSLPVARGHKKRIRDSHILIIGDDCIEKDLLSQLLVSKGGHVTSATTGREALKLLKKNKFDLAVADRNSPYIEASKIISKVKAMHPTLPVILVNARDEDESLGADRAFGRPLEMDGILLLVSETLQMRGAAE
ncbi:MAG: ATP-binding protein [Thermodesulfobacteriota bacterium]|nr:ATP-binding protein [Thermodesulfobacteriota bacterium]